jgi:hypothetical protein
MILRAPTAEDTGEAPTIETFAPSINAARTAKVESH